MISFTVLAATVTVTLAALAVLCVVATRNSHYQPSLAGAFGGTMAADFSAETLISARSEGTIAGDWKECELSRLCDAEEFLDCLEANYILCREMSIVGNDKFVVRWR